MNSVRFNLKRIIISLLCFTLVMCAIYCTPVIDYIETDAEAASTSEYEQMLKDLEEEKKQIEKEIANLKSDKADQNKLKTALQKKVNNTQSQINAVEKQISDLDSKIVDAQNSIEQKTQELEESKFTFRQRLRSVYMNGGEMTSSLGVLLSANGLEDLLTKSELTKSIGAYDKALMNKIVDDMKAIEKNKAEIEQMRSEQKKAKEKLADKKQELNAQIKEVNSAIGDIDSDIDKLKDDIDAIEKAEKEIEEQINNALNGGNNQIYDGEFAWPVPGYYKVGSPYGYRIHPISGKWKLHKGIDIGGSGIKGKPIVAAADGYVSLATYNTGGYGYYVVLDHGKGDDGKYYATLYAHMTKYIVKPNQYVRKGQTIGYVGTSGASTGYHLHFEVRIGTTGKEHKLNYATVDPMKYF